MQEHEISVEIARGLLGQMMFNLLSFDLFDTRDSFEVHVESIHRTPHSYYLGRQLLQAAINQALSQTGVTLTKDHYETVVKPCLYMCIRDKLTQYLFAFLSPEERKINEVLLLIIKLKAKKEYSEAEELKLHSEAIQKIKKLQSELDSLDLSYENVGKKIGTRDKEARKTAMQELDRLDLKVEWTEKMLQELKKLTELDNPAETQKTQSEPIKNTQATEETLQGLAKEGNLTQTLLSKGKQIAEIKSFDEKAFIEPYLEKMAQMLKNDMISGDEQAWQDLLRKDPTVMDWAKNQAEAIVETMLALQKGALPNLKYDGFSLPDVLKEAGFSETSELVNLLTSARR